MESCGFWKFNRRIFLRFCLATLYSGVLTAGLELALLSADKLFELKLEKSYAHLFFIMAGCFHPVFFLAGVPRDFTALETDCEHPRELKAFTQFALAPLVAVYTVILYVYAVKIALAREWPHGWVALPVLVLSGVGIFAALLLHPLRTRADEKWAGWFCRWFPRAFAPLSLLLLLSVRERIAAYGITEERYLGIVAGGWILVWAFLFIFKKNAGIRWIPASLAVICLVAAFGPLSAGAISKNNQLRRLQSALAAHGLLIAGKITVSERRLELPAKDYDNIHSIISYLIEKHGGETLRGLFGGVLKITDWKQLNEGGGTGDILEKLHLKAGPLAQTSGSNYHDIRLDRSTPIAVGGFQRVWMLQNPNSINGKHAKHPLDGPFISLIGGELKFADSRDAPPQSVPLGSFLESLPDTETNPARAEEMIADGSHNGHNYRIVFTRLNYSIQADGKKRINSCDLIVLEK